MKFTLRGVSLLEDNKKAYSIQELARELGIGRSLAYKLVKEGEIPSIQLGRRKIVPKAYVDRFLSEKIGV